MQVKSLNEIENKAKIKAALNQKADTLLVAVYLQPNASKNAFAGFRGEMLKVCVSVPPVENAANNACIEFFAKTFKLPKRNIWIQSGNTSRNKIIALQGISVESFRQKLQELGY